MAEHRKQVFDMVATESLIARRDRLLGPNVRLFYSDPVHLVRGSRGPRLGRFRQRVHRRLQQCPSRGPLPPRRR